MSKQLLVLGLILNVFVFFSTKKEPVIQRAPADSTQVYELDSTRLKMSVVAAHRNVPWDMVWGPDNWIWFTEQDGKVSRLDPGSGEITEVLQLDDYYRKRLGLMSMALHPDWKSTPQVFINYTTMKKDSSIVSKLVRFTFDGKRLVKPVLLKEIPGYLGHNGSRLVIDENRKLFWATGDLKIHETILNPAFANGKVLRLNLDGSIPSDNPFPGSPVWAMGFRVPQGLVRTPAGSLFIAEHGDATDDEVNRVVRSGNYGWPHIAGYADQPQEVAVAEKNVSIPPLKIWTPTIAPAGMDYYHSRAIPEWQNALLLTTLKDQSLRVLTLDATGKKIVKEVTLFRGRYGRIRDVCVSPRGDVYISTSNRDWNPPANFPLSDDDKIIRISPAGKIPAKERNRVAAKAGSQQRVSSLYGEFCASCHKTDGNGLEGVFPSLVKSVKVAGDKNGLLHILLKGSDAKSGQQMPSFAFLSDAEISEVANYVRTTFANLPASVTAEDVKKIRSPDGR